MAYTVNKDPARTNSPDNTQLNTSSPARLAAVLSPHDSNEVTVSGKYPRALYVGTTGNLTVVMLDAADDTVTTLFSNVPVGIFPISVRLIKSTGTTASTIVGLV